MFDKIMFVVPGVPVPKGRHRARVMQMHGRAIAQMYPDKKSEKYEKDVRVQASLARANAGLPVLDEPLRIVCEAVLPIPKSYSRKKRDRCLCGVLRPTGRPDVDNLCKAALDACNGILWRDDSLIVDLHVIKRYGADARLIMSVEPIATPLELAALESEVA